MSAAEIPQEIQQAFEKYSFYHHVEIAPGILTPGWAAAKGLTDSIRDVLNQQDVEGKRVLDIGCRDGLFCFEAERMGAASVIGIDNDLSTAATEFLIPLLKSKVEMKSLNLYDLDLKTDGLFDFVLFCGVLYHLRYPLLALDRIADIMKPGATMLLETAVWITPNEMPLLYCPVPEESPYEPTSITFYSHAGLVDALRAAGFEDIECHRVIKDDVDAPNKIGRELFTCKKAAPHERSEALRQYWIGTHSLNSSQEANTSFLADWGREQQGSSVISGFNASIEAPHPIKELPTIEPTPPVISLPAELGWRDIAKYAAIRISRHFGTRPNN